MTVSLRALYRLSRHRVQSISDCARAVPRCDYCNWLILCYLSLSHLLFARLFSLFSFPVSISRGSATFGGDIGAGLSFSSSDERPKSRMQVSSAADMYAVVVISWRRVCHYQERSRYAAIFLIVFCARVSRSNFVLSFVSSRGYYVKQNARKIKASMCIIKMLLENLIQNCL